MHTSPNEGPNLREKSILLVKIMQHIEKKFPDLNAQYLDIIIHIYRYCIFCYCKILKTKLHDYISLYSK